MAAKTTAFSRDILLLIFNNVIGASLATIGVQESLAVGALSVSLHTASPGAAGTASTNECAYTGYARLPLARSTTWWTVSGATVTVAQNVDFARCTAGAESATYAGISDAAGNLLYFGLLSAPISIAAGTIPRIEAGSTISES